MKKLLVPILHYALDKAKRNRFIQNLFESPLDLNKYPAFGSFTDQFGETYTLHSGLRQKIRPNKEQSLGDQRQQLNEAFLDAQKTYGAIATAKLVPLVEAMGISLEGSRVVEIGCHAGSAAYTLAEKGAKEVIGTEFSGYKVEAVQGTEALGAQSLQEVNQDLQAMRMALGKKFQNASRVQFLDDDICNTRLPKGEMDVVMSWEVLEHLHDPGAAFKGMAEVLRPGGLMVHEYNPFFCLNGGHSACTLDMLWGHTQLNEADFRKYVETFRPEEVSRATAFFSKGLNRMTYADLRAHIEASGMQVEALLPLSKEQHIRMVNRDILKRTQRLYPSATVLDLATPRVLVVARKG
jgi:2-polyprenyl-3-methyl-5-hydroxy-6-metoxy-1,4-benzoquinol methylase